MLGLAGHHDVQCSTGGLKVGVKWKNIVGESVIFKKETAVTFSSSFHCFNISQGRYDISAVKICSRHDLKTMATRVCLCVCSRERETDRE